MPPHRRLLVAAATNWLAFATTLLVSFFLAPYLIRRLGDARYGVWCVVESVLAYFTLFDLGLAACLVRFVARFQATGERDELNKVVSSCLAVFAVAAAAVLLLGGLLVPVVAPGLEDKLAASGGPGGPGSPAHPGSPAGPESSGDLGSPGAPGGVTAFMLLMLANLAVTLPLSVFPTLLDGLQRFAVKSLVRIGFLAAKVVGTVYALETAPGLWSLAVVFTVVNLLEHAVMGRLAFHYLPGLRLSHRLVDRQTLRRVRGYSVDAFLAMLAGRITVQTGAVVVGGFLPVAAAAHYAIAARLVEMAKSLFRSVTTTLTPAVSEREAGGDHDGVRGVYLSATRWVLYLVLPVQLGLLAFGRPFLHRWVGRPEYADWCYPAMAILSATLALGTAQSVASRVLYGLGRLRLFARLALLEAGLNLGLSLALVGPGGVPGVAVAVAVPNVLFCLFVIVYTGRLLEVPLGRYLVAGWLRPLVAAGVPAAVWSFVTPAEPTWPGLVTAIATGLLPYALAVTAVELVPRLLGAAVGGGRVTNRPGRLIPPRWHRRRSPAPDRA